VAAIDPLIKSKPVDLTFKGPLLQKFKEIRMLTTSMQKLKGDFASFYDIMTAPAKKILDEYFESEPLKVCFNLSSNIFISFIHF
jgi:hypothetical protein